MLKFVMLDGGFFPAEDAYAKIEALCRSKGVAFEPLYCDTVGQLIEKAGDADACMLTNRTLDGSFLAQVPRIKMCVRCGVGVDNLNLADFTRHGVYACNVPDYATEEVSAHTVAFILALERKVQIYTKDIHNGGWNEEIGYAMHRISTRTLGILGLGRIGRKTAGIAGALGYTLIACDPFLADNVFEKYGARKVDLDTLFRESDVLAVLAPATPLTYHIVNDANLAKMKNGSFMVVTSRGALVDLNALARALDSGKLNGAALDVLEQEPPEEQAKVILGRENVILTPHTAYRTVESVESMRLLAAETAMAFLIEGKLRNVVNPDVIGKAKPWPIPSGSGGDTFGNSSAGSGR
jgi:D-3-phosphoglycerate dehydrogenase